MSDEIEIWRPVLDFEDRYEVSNLGRVRSLSTYRPGEYHQIMRPYTQNKGYQYITLRRKGGGRSAVAVHRMVLEAFVGVRPIGMQAAHGNGNPRDNRLLNLRWATSKQNHADRRRHGRIPSGDKNPSSRLDASAARTIKKLRGLVSSYELAHLACVHPSTIESIWQGETWKSA